jgi:calcium/calmodulin-dependent protein kinase kinase 2
MFEGNNDEFKTDNGTKCFLAPEIFKTPEFNGRPLDIWAAGVSFFEILTGYLPFKGKVFEELK